MLARVHGARFTVAILGDRRAGEVCGAAGVDSAIDPAAETAEVMVRFAHDPRTRQVAMLDEDRFEILDIAVWPESRLPASVLGRGVGVARRPKWVVVSMEVRVPLAHTCHDASRTAEGTEFAEDGPERVLSHRRGGGRPSCTSDGGGDDRVLRRQLWGWTVRPPIGQGNAPPPSLAPRRAGTDPGPPACSTRTALRQSLGSPAACVAQTPVACPDP